MPAPLVSAGPIMFSVVVAATQKGGIGKTGCLLPWSIPEDLKFFSYLTRSVSNASYHNAVIMGRHTFDSLPDPYRPLPNRLNIIISTTRQQTVGHDSKELDLRIPICVNSFDAAMRLLSSAQYRNRIEQIFVIGGKQVYEEALKSPNCKSLYWTRIQGPASLQQSCDISLAVPVADESVFTPVSVSKTKSCGDVSFDFVRYERISVLRKQMEANNELQVSEALQTKTSTGFDNNLQKELARVQHFIDSMEKPSTPCEENQAVRCCPDVIIRDHEEFQYLDLVADIISTGFKQKDRTGVGTLSKLGVTMRFDLSKSFPLLTTKAVFWKGVVEELLWFIHGDTNSNNLSVKGVKIWDANGSRQFLDQQGFHYREIGDLGPVYGFQWRHFGAHYKDMNTDYRGQGIDQLKQCIHTLKTNPTNRRIVMSAWNPVDIDLMALPPCHLLTQFFVTEDMKLSCIMYQRSCDMGLGVPFNIASYSLLCCMVAQVCNLAPGEFIHVLGNAHVYLNHVEPLKEQLARCPRPFPILEVDPSIKDIDEFEPSHFELIGYSPYSKIPMAMAV